MTAPFASHPASTRGRRFAEPESATRTAYQRDRDRILHSGAFRKLQYKTQVFVYHEGDYYRTRLTHSLEVAQIARSMARSLELDEDLAEAVALAHDLGHTPFGHAGEAALDAAMRDHGGFSHNDQTVRVLTRLERRYAGFDGLNLTWETLEGVVKHNGPIGPGQATPEIAAFDRDWPLDLAGWPGAEAQVAALADDIAYNAHDLDDGIRANLFRLEELGALPLVGPIVAEVAAVYPGLEQRRAIHEVVRRLIDRLVGDLLAETSRRLDRHRPQNPAAVRAAGEAMVAFSDAVAAAGRELRDFLFRRMYRHYLVNRETAKARRVVRELFDAFMTAPDCLPTEWQEEAAPLDPTPRARLIADYIAGMTDRYALLEHQRLFAMGARV